MSSARLPLAIVVLGLAACAHSPSSTAYLLPDVRAAAPVIVTSSDDVPEGFDDHVVVSIDRDGLRRAQQQTVLASHRSSRYYYGYPAAGSTRSRGAATPTVQSPTARPSPAATPAPAARNAPRHFSNEARRTRH